MSLPIKEACEKNHVIQPTDGRDALKIWLIGLPYFYVRVEREPYMADKWEAQLFLASEQIPTGRAAATAGKGKAIQHAFALLSECVPAPGSFPAAVLPDLGEAAKALAEDEAA